jgi:hypothetical protein
MSDTLLSANLTQMTAGESISETVAFDDYLASAGWSVQYAFRGMSAFVIDGTTNDDGDSFDLEYSYQESKDFEPGIYSYSGFALKGNDRVKVEQGTLEILANPAHETYAQKVLAAIRAVIQGRATNDQLTISLADTQLQYMSADELRKLEQEYLGRVNREISNMSSDRDGPNIGVLATRFTGR